MKNKKKKILFLIILILIILTACILIKNNNSINSHKKEKTRLELKSDTIKKENKEEPIIEEVQEEKENNVTETDVYQEDKKTSNYKSNKQNNNTNTSSNQNSNVNSNTTPHTSNNPPAQNNTPSAPKEQQPAVDNRTAWEKLGISEYDYYHTEMYGARIDLYNTDISFCNSEAKRILNSYEDVANTRSYSGTGKYTYSYIGCSVDVTLYDGRTVGYNEAKRILGF